MHWILSHYCDHPVNTMTQLLVGSQLIGVTGLCYCLNRACFRDVAELSNILSVKMLVD